MANHASRSSSFVSQLHGRAPVKRRNRTHSESALWQRLSGNRLGIAFKRQVPQDRYIVDFLAPSLHLIVEVDGLWPHRRIAHDERRERKLTRMGHTSDEQGAGQLEVPVGLRGKVLEVLVVWQEVPSNERWPEGWFERTSGAVTDSTFVRHDVQPVEEMDPFE